MSERERAHELIDRLPGPRRLRSGWQELGFAVAVRETGIIPSR